VPGARRRESERQGGNVRAEDLCQNREGEFLDLAHQWLHTKMLKRSARFLLPGGADATVDGELALECRSCPIPGVNLPNNWRDLINQ
jgi:hypothetical protein